MITPVMAFSQFTPDTRLTNADSTSYTPFSNSRCIAVNGQSVHLTWSDRRDGAGEVFYKRSLDGGMTWSDDLRLTEDDGEFSGRATIALWNNEIHLVWMDRRDGNNELYYKRSVNNGATWEDDVRLTNNASISEYPSLAINFQTLHLVWNDDRHGANEIYYKRSLNGGLSWGADTRLTNNAGDSYKASVAVSDMTVHVAWEDLRNGTSEIFYKKSIDNGMMWGNEVKLSNSVSDCYTPCISANGPVTFLSWDDNRSSGTEIYTRRSTDYGDTWAAEFNMTNTLPTSYDASHVFSGTFMFLVWNEEVGGDLEIHSRFSTDAGLTWNPTRPLTTAPGDSYQPFVGVGGPIVHVVWRDDRDGNSEIYYKRNPNGNPFDHMNQLAYAHPLGSANKDVAFAITSDIYSNVYVAGEFRGTVDFDPGPGVFNMTADGSSDAFVYKLDPQGGLVWAKRIGGPLTDVAYGISLDAEWNVLLAGSFQGIADFDPEPGVFELGSLGLEDAFVLKLNNNGHFRWAIRMGGGGQDEARALVTSPGNEIFITGHFAETVDFDPGPNTANLVSNGEEDVFISKLDAAGNLMWAKRIGGDGFDAGRDLALDSEGNVITTGYFNTEADFDPGAGTLNLTSAGSSDIFILKLDNAGNFSWAHGFGSDEDDEGNSVTTDPAGNIYTTGFFRESADFNPGSGMLNLSASGNEDVFISKLDDAGNFAGAWKMGGPNTDEGRAIVHHNGYMYVTGHFQSTADFDPAIEVVELRASGSSDIFLQKLTDSGDFVWLNQFGGTQEDIGYALSPVIFGKTGVAGFFTGMAEFSPEIALHSFTSEGGQEAFVSVIRDCMASSSTQEVTACGSYSIPFPDTTFTISGTYTLIMESSQGCDSIITLNLTVLPHQEVIVTETACDQYTTPSGNHTWTVSGTYSEVLVSSNGCDSIITYHLTISESTGGSSEITACDVYMTPEGETLTESGVYIYHYMNAAGCDSTHTLNLTINHSTTVFVSMHACDSLISPSGGEIWFSSGTYQDIIPNAAGCDSLITIELTVGTTTFGSWAVDACHSFTTPDGSMTWFESGIYTYTVPNSAGCDSVITLDLGIFSFEAAVTQVDATLTALPASGSYQWVDCDQNYAPITGETSETFTALESGSYAVVVHINGCADTSACVEVMIVGLEDPEELQDVTLYPNPLKEKLFIRFQRQIPELEILMTDAQGKMVKAERHSDVSLIKWDMNQPSGVYFITLMSQGGRKTYRVMK
jgi:hypothetical protein